MDHISVANISWLVGQRKNAAFGRSTILLTASRSYGRDKMALFCRRTVPLKTVKPSFLRSLISITHALGLVMDEHSSESTSPLSRRSPLSQKQPNTHRSELRTDPKKPFESLLFFSLALRRSQNFMRDGDFVGCPGDADCDIKRLLRLPLDCLASDSFPRDSSLLRLDLWLDMVLFVVAVALELFDGSLWGV